PQKHADRFARLDRRPGVVSTQIDVELTIWELLGVAEPPMHAQRSLADARRTANCHDAWSCSLPVPRIKLVESGGSTAEVRDIDGQLARGDGDLRRNRRACG